MVKPELSGDRKPCGAATAAGTPCKRRIPVEHDACPSHNTKALQRTTEAETQQWEALSLFRRGRNFVQIAASLDCHHTTAKKLVYQALSELAPTPEQAVHARQLERSRLETLLDKVWPYAIGEMFIGEEDITGRPSLDHLDRAVRIIETLIKLDGLAQPAKVEHSGPAGGPIQIESMTRAERQELMDAIRVEAERRLHVIDIEAT